MQDKPQLDAGVIEVLVVEDHALMRECLVHRLGETGGLHVAGAYGTGADFLAAYPGHAPGCVSLVDLNLPDLSGIQVISEGMHTWPGFAAVAVTMWDHVRHAVQALGVGAFGYVTKSSPFSELVEAIHCASRGQRYICRDVARALKAHALYRSMDPVMSSLSDREFEVFTQLGEGRTLKEIAAELGVNYKTVSTYRARIMDKLQLTSQVDLIRLALEVQGQTTRV